MLNHICFRAAAFLLLLSFPAGTLSAQTATLTSSDSLRGVIYPQPGVTVKGGPVFTSTPVYAGDEIRTAEHEALLTGEGISMQLKPHTSLVYGTTAELGCGGLSLVTSRPVPVRLAGMEVTPLGNPAKLDISNLGGTTTVSLKSGMATLNQAGAISQLQAGQTIARLTSHECPIPASGAVQDPTAAGASSFLGGTALYWVIAGGAAAGIVAGVLATRSDRPISPSVP